MLNKFSFLQGLLTVIMRLYVMSTHLGTPVAENEPLFGNGVIKYKKTKQDYPERLLNTWINNFLTLSVMSGMIVSIP